ncbi:dethiobiotin synthase [Flexithrix dorotheae]|uniref:dethiobiotin synthase n=1 Tax=Flexithrix dorotheae TaxID=70993 RepID=UPI0003658740|nr:dethiobiotin synthase [Flexithrix dorotheae]
MKGKEFFISGIDTDCGKTYITGLLAYHLKKSGKKIITSKLIQTGCKGISEDILAHRKLMESDLLPEDKSGLTCPVVLSYPASPHLAAAIDEVEINFSLFRKSANELLDKYEIVLSEGAGGLMVPLTPNYLILDYIKENQIPLILVSSSKLGSINHTLLSVQACLDNEVNLHGFIYNQMPNHDEVIGNDSFNFFKTYLKAHSPETHIMSSRQLDKNRADDLKEVDGIFM